MFKSYITRECPKTHYRRPRRTLPTQHTTLAISPHLPRIALAAHNSLYALILLRWGWTKFLKGYIGKIEGFATSEYSRGMHEFVVDYFEDETSSTGTRIT
jgi:hypothetical protein